MPRVSHKKIKQLIEQRKKTITDKQFFTSRIFAGHFADIAVAQTHRYGYNRRVKVRIVWEPKTQNLACTEGEVIWINAGHPKITKKRGRQERYTLICGVFTHELGHILYTDFLSAQVYLNSLEAGKWYPEKPLITSRVTAANENEMWDYCKTDEISLLVVMKLAKTLNNVVEDGYVNNVMVNQYPGVLGHSLSTVYEHMFEDSETLTQMMEQEMEEGHVWLSIQQLILSYVNHGEIKYGDEPMTDERVKAVFALIDYLDNAIINPSSKERWKTVNQIILYCWNPYIRDFLDMCKRMAEEQQAAGDADANAGKILGSILSGLSGSSSEATGYTKPVTLPSGKCMPLPKAKKRKKTAEQAEEAKEENESDENTEDENGSGGKIEAKNESEDENEDENENGSGENDESEDENEYGEEPEELELTNTGEDSDSQTEDDDDEDGDDDGKNAQDVSSEETGRMGLAKTDKTIEATGDGTIEYNDDYTGSGYTNAAADIERILEHMAEKTVQKKLENERTAELNEVAQSISYGNIHEGVNIKVNRIAEVSDEMKEEYKEIAPSLLHISKQLQKSIMQQIKDRQRGGKMTGLRFGRRLDVHALPRNDGRLFYRNNLPAETPKMSIGILLDESGSMASRDRATYARSTAIILYDFCKSLGIPVMVYGHTTGYNTVELYSYAEFESIDRDDCFRMMDISARDCNRDGAALRFVAEQLSKRQEEIRMLILVSDGQPADSGYYGEAAEEDLRGIKHEYKRKGLLFLAAAIGEDKESIERIYSDSFLDISDLTRLPVILTNVIKKKLAS